MLKEDFNESLDYWQYDTGEFEFTFIFREIDIKEKSNEVSP